MGNRCNSYSDCCGYGGLSITEEDRARYNRNILLPDFGEEAQSRLLKSKVLVIGGGALGSVATNYLAGAGVGEIAISEFDTIEVTNLQRQVFFEETDVGRPKIEALCRHLRSLNSQIRIVPLPFSMTEDTARDIFEDYDLILECTDSAATKYMVSDIAALTGKDCILGGIAGFVAQVVTLPASLRYRDLFPPSATLPSAPKGVFGPAAGLSGSLLTSQALQTLITGRIFSPSILTLDLRTLQFSHIPL